MGNCWTEVTLFVENTKFVKSGFVLDIIFLCMNSKLVKRLSFSQILAISSGDDTYVWTRGVEWVIQLLNGWVRCELGHVCTLHWPRTFFWLKNRPRQKVHQWLAIVRYNGMCNVPRRQMHKASLSTNVQIHKYSNAQINKSTNGQTQKYE